MTGTGRVSSNHVYSFFSHVYSFCANFSVDNVSARCLPSISHSLLSSRDVLGQFLHDAHGICFCTFCKISCLLRCSTIEGLCALFCSSRSDILRFFLPLHLISGPRRRHVGLAAAAGTCGVRSVPGRRRRYRGCERQPTESECRRDAAEPDRRRELDCPTAARLPVAGFRDRSLCICRLLACPHLYRLVSHPTFWPTMARLP